MGQSWSQGKEDYRHMEEPTEGLLMWGRLVIGKDCCDIRLLWGYTKYNLLDKVKEKLPTIDHTAIIIISKLLSFSTMPGSPQIILSSQSHQCHITIL